MAQYVNLEYDTCGFIKTFYVCDPAHNTPAMKKQCGPETIWDCDPHNSWWCVTRQTHIDDPECTGKQIRYRTQGGTLETPSYDCNPLHAPALPPLQRFYGYFYGTEAEYADSIPPVPVCDPDDPGDGPCCHVVIAIRTTTGCRYLVMTASYSPLFGELHSAWYQMQELDDMWPMGAM